MARDLLFISITKTLLNLRLLVYPFLIVGRSNIIVDVGENLTLNHFKILLCLYLHTTYYHTHATLTIIGKLIIHFI